MHRDAATLVASEDIRCRSAARVATLRIRIGIAATRTNRDVWRRVRALRRRRLRDDVTTPT